MRIGVNIVLWVSLLFTMSVVNAQSCLKENFSDFVISGGSSYSAPDPGNAVLSLEENINRLSSEHCNFIENAAKQLGELRNKRAVMPLVNLLQHNDEDIKNQAIISLGKLKDSRAVQPLSKLLYGNPSNIRAEAVIALGKIGNQNAFVQLVHSYYEEKPKYIKDYASTALLSLHYDRAFLHAQLNEKQTWYRTWAAYLLGLLKDKGSVNQLIARLDDSDSDFKVVVITALERISDKRAITPLTKLLTSESQDIRNIASSVIKNLKAK